MHFSCFAQNPREVEELRKGQDVWQAQNLLLPGEQVPHMAGRDVSTCISLEKFPLYTCIKYYPNHRFLPHLWRWHSGAKANFEQDFRSAADLHCQWPAAHCLTWLQKADQAACTRVATPERDLRVGCGPQPQRAAETSPTGL